MLKYLPALLLAMLHIPCFAQSDSDAIALNTSEVSVKILKPEAVLYPNPAKNKVSISVNGFEPGMTLIRIMDISGNIVKEESRLLVDGNDEEIILFFFLPAGIYFVTMQEQQKWIRKKLVVE